MYAFGRLASAAREDLHPTDETRVDIDYNAGNKLSEGLHKYVYGMIMRGMASSMTKFMQHKGMDAKEISAKKVELANMFAASGEASDWQIDVVKGETEGADPEYCCIDETNFSPGYDGGSYYNILCRATRATKSELDWSFNKLKDKMDENAISIISSYREAMDAYYTAKDKYESLCNDVAVECTHDILLRFGDQLSKICPEWYTSVTTYDRKSYERLVAKRKSNVPTGEVSI